MRLLVLEIKYRRHTAEVTRNRPWRKAKQKSLSEEGGNRNKRTKVCDREEHGRREGGFFVAATLATKTAVAVG